MEDVDLVVVPKPKTVDVNPNSPNIATSVAEQDSDKSPMDRTPPFLKRSDPRPPDSYEPLRSIAYFSIAS